MNCWRTVGNPKRWRNICMHTERIGMERNWNRRAWRNWLRYWWRWFYLKYVKVIVTAIVTAIIEIIGELYVERRR